MLGVDDLKKGGPPALPGGQWPWVRTCTALGLARATKSMRSAGGRRPTSACREPSRLRRLPEAAAAAALYHQRCGSGPRAAGSRSNSLVQHWNWSGSRVHARGSQLTMAEVARQRGREGGRPAAEHARPLLGRPE